jgi:glycosyltransferase involved in cell wall biosynthesis
MATKPVVSVITPVYNGEAFLESCIQSVLSQTFGDWEYVIIDNHSTDRTPEIVQQYADTEPRIRLVRPAEFVGMYPNHNRSLREMHPEARYCKVLHADDFLMPECLEQMVAVAETNPSVGIVSAFRLVDTHVEHISPMPYPETVCSGKEVVRRELLDIGWVTGSASNLLMRADFVREREQFYDPTLWHADTEAAYRVLVRSDFGFVHQVLTSTRYHPGAATPFSFQVWSYISRDGLLLLRYGPEVMSAAEFQRSKWRWVRRYGRWLLREVIRPRRRHDWDFHDFHRREIDLLMAEAVDDRPVRYALSGYRRLLRSK